MSEIETNFASTTNAPSRNDARAVREKIGWRQAEDWWGETPRVTGRRRIVDKPSHERRLYNVLRCTLIHEFGHVAVAQHLGFAALNVQVITPAFALAAIGGGLFGADRRLNQNYLPAAARIAVAGVCAERLAISTAPSFSEIQRTLGRHRNRFDADAVSYAIHRAHCSNDLVDIVGQVITILAARMAAITDAAEKAAYRHVCDLPSMPYEIPAPQFTNIDNSGKRPH